MDLNKKLGKWAQLKKFYQGGSRQACVLITREIIDYFGNEEELSEYFGENTGGGHNYGYRIYCSFHKNKPDCHEMKLRTVATKRLY